MEEIVASDPNDEVAAANAICTMFLEMVIDTEFGNTLEPYLGKECKKFCSYFKV